MNIIIIKDKLKEGLDIISRASGEHPTLPILRNVLIEAKDGVISLVATNLEIGLRCRVAGKVEKEGSVTVPAALLSQVVMNLSDERVALKAEGAALEVITDSYKGSIQGSPAEEFPSLPKIENTREVIEMEAGVLRAGIESVLSAAQFSELRPELSSVFFQLLGDKIVLVATDSFRLAEKTLADNQFTSSVDDEFKVLLPLRTAQELARTLKDKGQVKIYHDPGQMLFSTEKMELISRLLEGTFPDYRAVVPKEYQAEVAVDRDEFVNAVKLTGVMSGSAAEIVVRPAAGKAEAIEVFSRDEKLGENSTRVPAKMKGSFREANFNWKYLLDGAKIMPPKEFVFAVNDDNKPAILKSRQDASFFYILMPILKG